MKVGSLGELRLFYQEFIPDKIIFMAGTNLVSSFQGSKKEVEDRRFYILSKSNGPKNINNDELYQKMKAKIIHTAHLSNVRAREQIVNHLKELYPQNYHNVFVWSAGASFYTGFKGHIAFAQFNASDNNSYGHDVLIIIA